MKPNTPKRNTPLRTGRGSETAAWTRLLVVLAVALSHVSSAAQRLIPGDSIRVRAFRTSQTERQWPVAQPERATHSSHRWAGLAIGGLAGGAIGALVAHANYEPTYAYGSFGQALGCAIRGNCTRPPLVETRGEATAAGALGGALLGGGLGYLVGKIFGRWETVSLDQLRVGAGEVSLSVRIRR